MAFYKMKLEVDLLNWNPVHYYTRTARGRTSADDFCGALNSCTGEANAVT